MCELGKQIKVEKVSPGLTIPVEWPTEAPAEPKPILQPVPVPA